MDIRHLTGGSRLFLPVWVEGGLFSVGDVHAAQGDGEVCVTAIECPGEVTLRFDVTRGAKIDSPHYLVARDRVGRRGLYGTTGVAPDLWEATKTSVRNMIDHLTREYHLTREEAYVLCSVSADLRIHEVVDKPKWVVGTLIPLDNFPPQKRRKEARKSLTRLFPSSHKSHTRQIVQFSHLPGNRITKWHRI